MKQTKTNTTIVTGRGGSNSRFQKRPVMLLIALALVVTLAGLVATKHFAKRPVVSQKFQQQLELQAKGQAGPVATSAPAGAATLTAPSSLPPTAHGPATTPATASSDPTICPAQAGKTPQRMTDGSCSYSTIPTEM